MLVLAVTFIGAARGPWFSSSAPILTSLGFLTAVAALWLDRARAWVPVALAGTALNALAIIANRGRMPVNPAALNRLAGGMHEVAARGLDSRHVLAGPGTPFGFLGDQIAVILGRAGTILSPGDLLMAAGIAGALQAAMVNGALPQPPQRAKGLPR
jgi:hypothetical protein